VKLCFTVMPSFFVLRLCRRFYSGRRHSRNSISAANGKAQLFRK
jgi:hypothetical protein